MARPRKEDGELKLVIRQKAQNIETYLNKMEEVFSNYSMAEQQTDKLSELSMTTGKIMITFSDLCTMLGIFDDK